MIHPEFQKFKVTWVLIDEVGIGKAPSKDKHAAVLAEAGIKSILSLCSPEEASLSIKIEENFVYRRLVLPDHKSSKSIKLDQLNQALDVIEEFLQSAGPVYVHCIAAMERSPLVCLGWLIRKHQLDPQSALDYMMQIHPGTNPLPEQLNLLNHVISEPKYFI